MRILMVCLGNICRSPLAEGVMRQLVREKGLNWEIASAGTGDWHIGNPPDRRSVAVAKTFGYDISAQRARHFTAKSFEQFDHILVMDSNNHKDVLGLATSEAQRDKVSFFLQENGEVSDPYFDNFLFEPVFKQIESRCRQLIKEWLKES